VLTELAAASTIPATCSTRVPPRYGSSALFRPMRELLPPASTKPAWIIRK